MKVLAITKNPSKQNRENSPLKEQEGNLHILKKKKMSKCQKSSKFREGR